MDLFSLEIERVAISGLITNKSVLYEIEGFIIDEDFYDSCNQVLYILIKKLIEKNETVNPILLSAKLKEMGINLYNEISIEDYVKNITFIKVSKNDAIKAFKELSKLRIKRELLDLGNNIKEAVKRPSREDDIINIITKCDLLYSDVMKSCSKSHKEFTNMYDDLEKYIEDIADNPPNEKDFLYGPFKSINEIYGPLLSPGHINLIGARTGAKKTALGMFFTNYVAEKYNIPVLHLDFSEMPMKELQIRAVNMFTKGEVPIWAIESGKWRNNDEWKKAVKEVWPRIKNIKMYYEDIGGLSPHEVLMLIKAFYYKHVGRGNKFIIHYDYLKPFELNDKLPEYKQMGHFIQNLKVLLSDIPACVWVSLQLNRKGINLDRTQEDVDDTENSFSLSDRIVQQCSHAWLLRSKLNDEIVSYGKEFGDLILKCLKPRKLGKNWERARNKVKMLDGKMRSNYINLQSKVFYFEDKGDLNDMIESLENHHNPKDHQHNDGQLL